jgi:hypothetical protein
MFSAIGIVVAAKSNKVHFLNVLGFYHLKRRLRGQIHTGWVWRLHNYSTGLCRNRRTVRGEQYFFW